MCDETKVTKTELKKHFLFLPSAFRVFVAPKGQRKKSFRDEDAQQCTHYAPIEDARKAKREILQQFHERKESREFRTSHILN